MTPCKGRLGGSDDAGQERVRVKCGPDGGDLTMEVEDAPELATLSSLSSAKQTLI